MSNHLDSAWSPIDYRRNSMASETQSRAPTAMTALIDAPSKSRKPRKLILCFDGTGNKFHGDDSDSNILKIFRMLDRTADDQYHYYQRKKTYTHISSLTYIFSNCVIM